MHWVLLSANPEGTGPKVAESARALAVLTQVRRYSLLAGQCLLYQCISMNFRYRFMHL